MEDKIRATSAANILSLRNCGADVRHCSTNNREQSYGYISSHNNIQKSSTRPSFLALPREIREIIYTMIALSIEIHPCQTGCNGHGFTEPLAVMEDCFPPARVPYRTREHNPFRVFLLGYCHQKSGTVKLPRNWHLWPALVCRQLRHEWLAFFERAPFRSMSVDAGFLPFVLLADHEWLRRQVRNIHNLQVLSVECRNRNDISLSIDMHETCRPGYLCLQNPRVRITDMIKTELKRLRTLQLTTDTMVIFRQLGHFFGWHDGDHWLREMATLQSAELKVSVRVLHAGVVGLPDLDELPVRTIAWMTGKSDLEICNKHAYVPEHIPQLIADFYDSLLIDDDPRWDTHPTPAPGCVCVVPNNSASIRGSSASLTRA